MGALGTETARPTSPAAQCVACIGVIELAVGQWQEVIPHLVNNINQATLLGAALSAESLVAIGFICADIVSFLYFFHSLK